MPSYVQSILPVTPLYIQPGSYSAQSDRKPFGDLLSEGVVGQGDLLGSVTGGNMQITTAAGIGWVLGGNIPDQGMYRCYVASSIALTATTADATKPRLDQLILRVLDNAADSSGANEGRLELVPGVATTGATLDNRSGAANLAALLENSTSLMLLTDVLVGAGATTIPSGNIRDRRTRAIVGGGNARIPLLTTTQFAAWQYQPIDGDIIDLLVDSSAGVIWRFRYRTASGSAYKWEAIGDGPPLLAINDAGDSGVTPGSTYGDFPTAGPSVTAPRAGDYLVDWGWRIDSNVAPAFNIWVGPKRGATNPSDAESTAITLRSAAASRDTYSLSKTKVFTVAVGDVIKLVVRSDAGGGNFDRRWIKIKPIRIS